MKNETRYFIHRLNGKDIAITTDPNECCKIHEKLTRHTKCKLVSTELNEMSTTYNYTK